MKRRPWQRSTLSRTPNDLCLLIGLGNKVKDYLILELNQFVYRKNCAGEELNMVAFVAYLRSQERPERQIAEENTNKMLLHLRKWIRVGESLDLDLPKKPI